MTLRHDSGPGWVSPGKPVAGASGGAAAASGTDAGASGGGAGASGTDAGTSGGGAGASGTDAGTSGGGAGASGSQATSAGPGQDLAVRHRPRGALAAALTIAVVALLGLAGLTAFLLAGHHRPAPVRAPLPAAFRLRTGQCVDSAANGVSSLKVVPCGLAHDGEIYATFRLARQAWPGAAAVAAGARQGCTARIGSYLNPQLAAAIMTESYIVPGQGAWEAGVRTVVCEIRGATGQLTGSVRGLK
jgi:Septum formation